MLLPSPSPGGGGATGLRGPPARHRQDPPLCQSGPVQTPRPSLPQVGHPALLGGLGDPQGGPDDQPSGHTGDAGGRHNGRGGCLGPRTLQRHGQVLHQGLPGAEEGLQEGDSGSDKGAGQPAQ